MDRPPAQQPLVHSLTNSHFKKRALAFGMGVLASSVAWAAPAANSLPTLNNIAAGSATLIQHAGQAKLTVNQTSDKLIANWNNFDVGKDAKVVFKQPAANSVALNRITSTTASQVFGQVVANGQLILINPNGLLIGKTGQIAASSVILSTLNMTDSSFNSDNPLFEQTTSTGEIDQQGKIKALNGNISLLASRIKSKNGLKANNGNINFLESGQLNGIVDLASLYLSPQVANLIQGSGLLEANNLNHENGRIYITGSYSGNNKANHDNQPSVLINETQNLLNAGLLTVNANGIKTPSAENSLTSYNAPLGTLNINLSFRDKDVSSQPASIGGTGLSIGSEPIKQLSTYAGWNMDHNLSASITGPAMMTAHCSCHLSDEVMLTGKFFNFK